MNIHQQLFNYKSNCFIEVKAQYNNSILRNDLMMSDIMN